MFNRFFVLGLRGDPLISRTFRVEGRESDATEIFYRYVSEKQDEALPVFMVDGWTYFYIKKSSLFFVLTTEWNVAPNVALELLVRIASVFKDYCGIVSEDSIRKNYVLCYELLDEMMDYGYPQSTSVDLLKNFVYDAPILTSSEARPFVKKGRSDIQRTSPSSAASKPVVDGKGTGKGNEVFLDLLENISTVFNPSGSVVRAEVVGTVRIKSYLSGNPDVRLGLNENLQIGSEGGGAYPTTSIGSYGLGAVVLDAVNFHECAVMDEWDSDRVLSFRAPSGEFNLLNYRTSLQDFKSPLKLSVQTRELDHGHLLFVMRLQGRMPAGASGINIVSRVPFPKSVIGISLAGEQDEMPHGFYVDAHRSDLDYEYKKDEHKMVWRIKKLVSGKERTLALKLALTSGTSLDSAKREISSVGLDFEIPMYVCSGVQIRYLRISDRTSEATHKWVRYITRTDSFLHRLNNGAIDSEESY